MRDSVARRVQSPVRLNGHSKIHPPIMTLPLRFILSLAFGVAAAGGLSAADADHSAHHHGAAAMAPAAGTPEYAAWLATAKAAYPLDTCVVSGDKLEGGDMGAPIDYVYKQEGKPDRLIRFCCKDCVKDFNKDPAKYLAMIDAAAAKKAAEHAGHSHS